MADPNVNINVSARDQASGVFERIAKNLKAMQAESRREGEGAFQRAFSSGEGAAGALADYLGVGLQAIILDQVGKALSNVTAKAVELRDKFREGKAEAADIAVGLLKSLPILGSFASAGENIHELFTGWKAEVAAFNKEMERGIQLSNSQYKATQQLIDATANLALAKRKAEVDLANIGRGPNLAAISSIGLIEEERKRTAKQREDEFARKAMEEAEKAIAIQRQKAFDAGNAAEAWKGWTPTSDADKRAKDAALENERMQVKKLKEMVAKGKADEAAIRKSFQDAELAQQNLHWGKLQEAAKKHVAGEIDSATKAASAWLKTYADLVEQGKETASADAAANAAGQRQREADRESEKSARGRALDALNPAYDANAAANSEGNASAIAIKSAMADAFRAEARTPDLILGRGSGAAARQREESTARNDKQLNALNEAVANLRGIRDALTKNTAPPAFTSAY